MTDIRPALVHHSERHGFVILRDFRNDRGCIVQSQQSWRVEHPTGGESWGVLGYHSTLGHAHQEIDKAHADAHDPGRLDALASKRRRWVNDLARWFPHAPNPPLALARIEAAETQRHADEARHRSEAKRIERIHQHAEATLVALEGLLVLYWRAQHLAEVRAAIAAVAQSRGIPVAEVTAASTTTAIGMTPIATAQPRRTSWR